MNKDLVAVFEYLEREKGISREVIIAAIEESLRAAARKSIGGAANVTVKINPKTGDIEVYSEKEIVEEVEVPAQEILLEDARQIDPECDIGQFIDVETTPENFGRIAAQKARHVISQKLRGAERDVIYEEYRHRANELISGTVKRIIKGGTLIVDLGKVEAVMPLKNYPKTESYHVGDKVLALLLGVQDTEGGGAEVVLSRSHPDFVRQLMIQEVPEINDGTVTIDKLVREPGYRTKLTVRSMDPKVDPVGACVGMRGVRVKNVVRELNNEKIDIIPYALDPVELLQNALSPVEVRKVSVNESNKSITIVVDDDDFATVIGKKGMNARLNGQLIGFELGAQRMSEYNRLMAVQMSEELESAVDPALDQPLGSIEGISALVVEQLAGEGYTLRSLLTATPERLATIPGISLETAQKVLEQARKQRK